MKSIAVNYYGAYRLTISVDDDDTLKLEVDIAGSPGAVEPWHHIETRKYHQPVVVED